MTDKRTPVYLLTGFLGSGKTTLLNAALRELPHTAVVVNELGDIGLDQLAVGQAADNVVLLDAGCLCCINPGALHETLADLIARRARGEIPPFERVVIETSGAVDPAPLLHVLLGHPLVTPDYRLAAVICTVDAQHFMSSKTTHAEALKQAAMADRIAITKRDLADPTAVVEFLRAINPETVFVDDARQAFSGEVRAERPSGLFGPIRPHGKPGGIRAFAFRPAAMTWAGWAAWSQFATAKFGARLLRVKGLLKMQDTGEVVMVHGVQGVFHKPQRFRGWPDADQGNRLVCVARDIEGSELEESLRESETHA